jgi:hypothetical protein
MRRMRKFTELGPAARGLFLYCLVLNVVVELGIRVRPVTASTRFLARLGRLTQRVHGRLGPQETARLVVAAGSVVRARCLARSLVLAHILKLSGAAVALRLGVAVSACGDLSAHAWIELDGAPIADGPDLLDRYAPFAPIAIGLDRASGSRIAR